MWESAKQRNTFIRFALKAVESKTESNMKATAKQVKEANIKLERYGLELSYTNPDSKTVKCFCTILTPTVIQLENMNIINAEIMTCDTYNDIKYMPYFK